MPRRSNRKHDRHDAILGEQLAVAQDDLADVAEEKTTTGQNKITLTLRYDDANAPVIEGITRISRPGLRHYVSSDALPKVRGGLGMAILSTSRGVMSDHQARKDRVGGEVICHVW